MDLSSLKAKKYDINKLVAAAKEAGGGNTNNDRQPDPNLWKPTVDKVGNGYAVIRFLPSEGDVPWVRYWDHGFKGPTGKWYIEKSLTSIGQSDPLGELNSRLWNSGREKDRDQVRRQKRRLHYVTNILVVSDPSAPENEGKVFGSSVAMARRPSGDEALGAEPVEVGCSGVADRCRERLEHRCEPGVAARLE